MFHERVYGLEAKPVNLFASVAIGAAGAPTLSVAASKGIKSITRVSAGKYTVTLDSSYFRFLDFDVVTTNATGISAAPNVAIVSGGTNVGTQGAGTVQFVCSTGGVATDPASGDVLTIRITVSDSSV